MKKLYTKIALLLTMGSMAQNVNIPDSNFKKALLKSVQINKDNNTEISLEEASQIKRLYIYNENISQLTGIEKFVNLELLYCQNNLLSELDLSELTQLNNLNCSKNLIKNIKLPKSIQELNCSENQLTNLDFSTFYGLSSLICNDNLLTSLSIGPHIEYLFCWRNLLSELDLSHVNNYSSINCTSNPNLKTIYVRHWNYTVEKDATASYKIKYGDYPGNCYSHVAITGICEDFFDANSDTPNDIDEYAIETSKVRWENGATNPAEKAYMGAFWTQQQNKNGFTALKSRKGDGTLKYTITQKDTVYEPFMLVFGSYSENDREKKMTLDLSDNSVMSFDLKIHQQYFEDGNPMPLGFFVQLEDINGFNLMFDKVVTNGSPQTWIDGHQIGSKDIPFSWSEAVEGKRTFFYDFRNAICGVTEYKWGYKYNEPSPELNFDFSNVTMVKFIVSGKILGEAPRDVINQELEISNFRLGSVNLVTSLSNSQFVAASNDIYKVYDLMGNFITEGKKEEILLPKNQIYILKSDKNVEKWAVLE